MEYFIRDYCDFNLNLFINSETEMRIWLDDVRPMPGIYDTHVYTAHHCIAYFKTEEVSLISFDHDLGDPKNGTGYDVACWIEEQAFLHKLKPVQWNVHSQNPVGKEKIITAMMNAEKYWRDEVEILSFETLQGNACSECDPIDFPMCHLCIGA